MDSAFNLTSARVVLRHQKGIFTAKVTINGPGIHIQAKTTSPRLLAAIDTLFNRAATQMQKGTSKRKAKKRFTSLGQIERQIRDKYEQANTELFNTQF